MERQVVQAENEELQKRVKDLTAQLSDSERLITKLKGDTQQKQVVEFELTAKMKQADAERSKLEAKLTEMAAKLTETKQLISTLQSNMLQAESDKHTLRTELRKAAAARSELELEVKALSGKTTETRDLMAKLKSETAHAHAEKLDLEARLREANLRRSAIESELQGASTIRLSLEAKVAKLTADLEAAKLQPLRGAAASAVAGVGAVLVQNLAGAGSSRSEKVSKEIQRIESMLTSTMKLMDDPEMELSMVMRKSNEYRELQSYLRGIRFASDGDSPVD